MPHHSLHPLVKSSRLVPSTAVNNSFTFAVLITFKKASISSPTSNAETSFWLQLEPIETMQWWKSVDKACFLWCCFLWGIQRWAIKSNVWISCRRIGEGIFTGVRLNSPICLCFIAGICNFINPTCQSHPIIPHVFFRSRKLTLKQ